MTTVKYLICTMMLLGAMSCVDFDKETTKIEELDKIENTLWYSYDVANKVYYNIEYSDTKELTTGGSLAEEWYQGRMTGYDSYERENEIEALSRDFIYTFTPATADTKAIVRTKFEDGLFYDGYVIPKGYMQISMKDVFVVQLFEVDADGKPIMNDNGTDYKSTLMMWKE